VLKLTIRCHVESEYAKQFNVAVFHVDESCTYGEFAQYIKSKICQGIFSSRKSILFAECTRGIDWDAYSYAKVKLEPGVWNHDVITPTYDIQKLRFEAVPLDM
jgi:hypothetical protein